MSATFGRCKLAYRLALGSLLASLFCLVLLGLQFHFRKELGESNAVFLCSILGFLVFLLLSHVFTGWLAVLNGLSWVYYGLSPIMKPIGGVAFSIFELRSLGKDRGWR